MFCTICAIDNRDGRRGDTCVGCGASLASFTFDRTIVASSRGRTLAELVPVVVILVILLGAVGRGWQSDRRLEERYRTAQTALADGQPMRARAQFSSISAYRDAAAQTVRLDAALAPLEARTRIAGDLLAAGDPAAAITELRSVVAEVPDHAEALMLLEQARRALELAVSAESDRLRLDGDIVGARQVLAAGLRVEPSSASLRARLVALEAADPLLLVTNGGSVIVTDFAGDRQRTISTGRNAAWAVWSPDRSMVAFLAEPDEAEDWTVQIWVVDADGGGERLLAGDGWERGALSWSPDGRSIAYVTPNHFDFSNGAGWIGLRLIDVTSGAVRELTGAEFNFTTSAVWSPDGRQIAFVERHIYRPENTATLDARGGDVFLLDIATGQSRNLTGGRVVEAFWVSWSPRGDEMLILTDVDEWASPDPNRLIRLDVATGTLSEVTTRGIVTRYPIWSPDGSMFALAQDDRIIRIWSDIGESWVRLPTTVDPVLSWSPDGSAIIVPPKNLQDLTHVIHVGDQLGRVDTIRVAFDASSRSGGPPQWGPRTHGATEESLPGGTALD